MTTSGFAKTLTYQAIACRPRQVLVQHHEATRYVKAIGEDALREVTIAGHRMALELLAVMIGVVPAHQQMVQARSGN